MPLLHYTFVRGSKPASARLLVLHGIFGQGRNWASVANVLVQLCPEWEVVLADLRMHGKSREGFAPPHTVAACAGDVEELCRALGGVTAVLGHSFGGKVVLALLERPGAPPAHAWVVDADPSAREPGGSSWEMLRLLQALPREWPSRERFTTALLENAVPPATAGWMATNLERAEGRFRLALDLEAMESLLRDYFAYDAWPALETPGVALHLVQATGSAVIGEQTRARILRSPARLHALAGGHWVNADNPGGMAELLASVLPRSQ